ncbi:MAG: hypothetical protein GEEBNDBF_01993 [bacterium]|nr:hypothetical protein [bacterium]
MLSAWSLACLICSTVLLLGCPGSGSTPLNPGDPGDPLDPGDPGGPGDPGDPPGPPPLTASIRLVEGTATTPTGTSVVVAEEFNTTGLLAVEWDFAYDGTTFTPDFIQAPPTIPGPPVRLPLMEPGFRTIALRGRYPNDALSPTATLTLTITPPDDPTLFGADSQDIGALIYEAPVFRGSYTDVQGRGGQGLAVRDSHLAAGWWGILDGQPGYFVTASADGGSRWTTPQRISTAAEDRPNINREPQLVLTPTATGFLVVWLGTDDTTLRAAALSVMGRPATLTLSPPATLPSLAGSTLATNPSLFTDPADASRGRLLAGHAGNGQGLLVVPWQQSGETITFGTPARSALEGIPIRIRGSWAAPTQLVAIEHRQVSLGGGTSGGGQSSVRIRVDLARLSPAGVLARTTVLDKSGQPQRLTGYEATLAATADRFLLAWIEEAQPPFFPGGLSVAGGSYDASAATVDGFYSGLTDREDIAQLAAVAGRDRFALAYALPRLDVDPQLATGRSEELYSARLPWLPGAAESVDVPINRGDPDGNEGLEQPSLTRDADGAVYACWMESHWNRKGLGRVGFNRTWE